MLVKAFNDYKQGLNLDDIADKIKMLSDYNEKNTKQKIIPFDAFVNKALNKEDEAIYEMKYLTGRQQYVNESKVTHAERVLKVLSTKDLPEADGLDCKNSQVGSFISSDEIVELYGDSYEGILDRLGDDGMLLHSWGDETAWWQKKKDEDGEGLVRIE